MVDTEMVMQAVAGSIEAVQVADEGGVYVGLDRVLFDTSDDDYQTLVNSDLIWGLITVEADNREPLIGCHRHRIALNVTINGRRLDNRIEQATRMAFTRRLFEAIRARVDRASSTDITLGGIVSYTNLSSHRAVGSVTVGNTTWAAGHFTLETVTDERT